MDASQYKDYILTLLFVKYVTDRFKGEMYADITVPDGGSFDDIVALKHDKNIGEGIDKVIAKLAGANNLRGVIDNAHFNDDKKLGNGQEMVDKLSDLVAIFQRPELDFKKNRASDDDIIGDAYEYLMRNFATESGKSKGQFYTPAEVSRVLAKVIGIGEVTSTDISVYDPACGSGSLLIRAANEASVEVAIYGQEKDNTTAGLAKMNLVLHNKASGVIIGNYSTFSDPKYFEDEKTQTTLRRFDFIVANPPFSSKNWTDGLKEYGRFDGYGDRPPQKNGDYAWLLHILKSLKSKGKAAVILPHGVLFRGNAEGTIRKSIVDRGYIKGIIGLPPNLFYGTSIPACVIVIDKEGASSRQGIFMIDASHDFVKDGNKNRLRERDIYKIVKYFNEQIEEEGYSRFVPNSEIKKKKNGYNLNIPRYIDSREEEDLQNIDAHLNGGIPADDIDGLETYWKIFGALKSKLFKTFRPGYYQLIPRKEDVRDTIYTDDRFNAYADKIGKAFSRWQHAEDGRLRNIGSDVRPKDFIVTLAEQLLRDFGPIELLDKYDVYQVLLAYWNETMADDVHVLVHDGYAAARETENIIGEYTSGKKKGKPKVIGWDGKLLPKTLLIDMFFAAEKKAIADAEIILADLETQRDALSEEQTEEGGALFDYLNDKDAVDDKKVETDAKPLRKKKTLTDDEELLLKYADLVKKVKDHEKIIKALKKSLDEMVRAKYPELSDAEILELLVNRKWYYTLFSGIEALYTEVSHHLANRVLVLAERYEETLPCLEKEVASYDAKVKKHLSGMGFNLAQELLTGQCRLPGFTKPWKKTTLGACLIKILGGGTPSRKVEEYWNGNIPWVTVKDFSTFRPDTTQEKITPLGLANSASHLIPAGTLIIATRMNVGRLSIYDVDVAINQDLKALFPKRDVCSKYLFFMLTFLQPQIEKLGTGSTVSGIRVEQLRDFSITLPSDIEEQKAIANILSDIDSDIENLIQKLNKLKQLKQGMMSELLTGRIRFLTGQYKVATDEKHPDKHNE